MTRRISILAGLCIVLGVPSGTVAQDAPVPAYQSMPVNGIALAYRDIGNGPPLVLLHGFLGTGAVWDPMLKDLSSKHRVIVPDLRGHGRSINPSGRFTHRELALDVLALLDRLGIERFDAMGISMGAMTLLHASTIAPARIGAMVLVGGTPYLPEAARVIYRNAHPDSIPRDRLEAAASRHSGGVSQVMALFRQFHAYKDSYGDMSFTPPQLATIQASTLIVQGDRDQFFPVEMAMEMYQAIPQSYLWVVPNGRHPAPFTTASGREGFVPVVLDFLDGRWARR